MLCDLFETCAFFQAHSAGMSTKKYEHLVQAYCEGPLQPKCKRLKWRADKNEVPPTDLCPNGYLIDSAKKFYD